MFNKIKFEWFIIKQFIKLTWRMCRFNGSLRPAITYLNPRAIYEIEKDGKLVRKRNRYTYVRDFWKDAGYL